MALVKATDAVPRAVVPISGPKSSADPAPTAKPQSAKTEHVNLDSVARISKLPVVEESIKTASNIYGKIKDNNRVFRWTLGSAETAVGKVVELTSPLTKTLEEPISFLDILLCYGLDYVEEKILDHTKQVVQGGKQYVYDTLKSRVQSANDSVRTVVQSGVNCAWAAKDFGLSKLGGLFGRFGKTSSEAGEDVKDKETHKPPCTECNNLRALKNQVGKLLKEEKASQSQ
uniref:Uncharacterized protein n=1 Tax=Timema poppense TaxID=170557 RepID=A0A7R9DAF1_TIMPO|nr:unnamed protein product [Timema poppensis]